MRSLPQHPRIGFMQGRLSPLVEGKIQAFPWDHWREEFASAESMGLGLMEWTLDQDRLYDNPLMRTEGRSVIRGLMEKHSLRIPSLTGDCFMQAPFWKAKGAVRSGLMEDFDAIVGACASLGIQCIVVPLVDNGRLECPAQEDDLVASLGEMRTDLAERGVKIVFESDFGPRDLARLMERFEPSVFGVNYDIGNSAALGFDPDEEFTCYGTRILNVHVKDRLLAGTTVPLGTGRAEFEKVFCNLHRLAYSGNYVMQTARADDGDHVGALRRYHEMIKNWVERYDT